MKIKVVLCTIQLEQQSQFPQTKVYDDNLVEDFILDLVKTNHSIRKKPNSHLIVMRCNLAEQLRYYFVHIMTSVLFYRNNIIHMTNCIMRRTE